MEFLGHTVVQFFNYLRNLSSCFHSGCTTLHTHQQRTSVPFSPCPHQHLLFVLLFFFCLFQRFIHSVISNSLRPHGLWPTRILCPWNSPGKKTGVGCHFLLHICIIFDDSHSGKFEVSFYCGFDCISLIISNVKNLSLPVAICISFLEKKKVYSIKLPL